MALPQVKALALFAVVISVSGISYALFFNNASAKLASIMNLGATSVKTLGLLFIPIAIFFLYGAFRK